MTEREDKTPVAPSGAAEEQEILLDSPIVESEDEPGAVDAPGVSGSKEPDEAAVESTPVVEEAAVEPVPPVEEAIAGNPEAAAVSGSSVFGVTMGAFILAGILYGFGSWLECARMVGSGSAAYGQGWEMDAIAACVVGGVSFTGGIGKISGVVVGVLIFTVLIYSLTILGIDTNLQFVFEGIIIITAVTLDCLKYVQKK